MKKLLLFIAVTLSFSTYSIAQENFDRAKMDQYIDAIESNNKAMGTVALSKDGKVIYKRAFGYADLENGVKSNPETIFRIGSISKTFTAAIIFQLIDEGKLTLDTKLSTFFPDIKNAESISIDHLLAHQSGIFNFTNDPQYLTYMEAPKSKTELLDIIKSYDSAFEPGDKTSYSNSNYVLLTWIAEDLSGKSFDTLIANLCTACGLTRTQVGSKIDIKNNESYSYKYAGDWKKETETDMSIPLGAGAITSTPSDLTAFLHCLFNGKIVSAESLKLMKEIRGGIGRGLFSLPFYDKVAYGHNGGIDGFQSGAFQFEADDLTLAVVMNGINYGINDFSIGVLSILYGKEYEIPSFKTVEVSPELMKKYVGLYKTDAMPLDLTFTVKDNKLYGQATGQSSFPLDAASEHTFKFDAAGIELIFNPDKNQVTLNQGGGTFVFTKEE